MINRQFIRTTAAVLLLLPVLNCQNTDGQMKRARDYGIEIGILRTGSFNAITDVPGVKVRIPYSSESMYEQWREIRNDEMDLLFQAAAEATEEAIINSLFAAETTKARNGMTVEALPVEETLQILRKYNRLKEK